MSGGPRIRGAALDELSESIIEKELRRFEARVRKAERERLKAKGPNLKELIEAVERSEQ